MVRRQKGWLSLTEAAELLGVHSTTLRRWTDSGSIPYFRTPGGHRRFRANELPAWIEGKQTAAIALQLEALVRNAVGFTRQEMSRSHVSNESWYLAFDREEERQQMRDTGRHLLGLAIQYTCDTRDHGPVLQEGRRIGRYYGQQCARHDISLVDTVRALFFFRDTLLTAARPNQASPGSYDAEDVRIRRQLRDFSHEITYACLASYEATCSHLLQAGATL